MSENIKITGDKSVSKNELVFRKGGKNVVRGTLNTISFMLNQVPSDRYDEIAVHPSVYDKYSWVLEK